ncbi:MAG: hypothetical protein NTY36_13985 [Deltaproteobacteria bacterium]|nr:hypothetical protein [Deltaproteobacteria bacterium]
MENESELRKKELERKLDVIRDTIQKAFPDSEIVYREKSFSLYKFQVNRKGLPPCCLVFTWECLLQTEDKIIEMLRREKVFERLSNTSSQMNILITDTDVREVNEIMCDE